MFGERHNHSNHPKTGIGTFTENARGFSFGFAQPQTNIGFGTSMGSDYHSAAGDDPNYLTISTNHSMTPLGSAIALSSAGGAFGIDPNYFTNSFHRSWTPAFDTGTANAFDIGSAGDAFGAGSDYRTDSNNRPMSPIGMALGNQHRNRTNSFHSMLPSGSSLLPVRSNGWNEFNILQHSSQQSISSQLLEPLALAVAAVSSSSTMASTQNQNNQLQSVLASSISLQVETTVLESNQKETFRREKKSKSQSPESTSESHISGDEDHLQCDECEYRAKYESELTIHKRIHSGEKPYSCDQCDHRCSHKSNLTKHKRSVHSEIQPEAFVCDVCQLPLKSKQSLVAHKETHVDYSQRPLGCNQSECKYRCFNQRDLDLHMVKHRSGKGQWKCDICSEFYAQKRSLVAHQFDVHSNGQLPFQCRECDVRCKSRNALNTHWWSDHYEADQ